MPQYFLLILAANAFFGALLYYFGNSMGISKRTSLIITGVSFVISFFFPIALSYLKLYQILVIILTVITLTAYLLQKDFHSQEQEYDEQINKEPDFVELKTAEDYLKAEEDKYANEAAAVLDEAPTYDEAVEQPASEIHINTRLDIEPEQEPEPEAQPEPEPELELEADTEAEPETELVSEPEPALVPEPEIEPEQNSITLRNADIQVYGETSLVTKDNFNEVAIIPLLEQAEKAATEEEPVRDIFEYIDKAFSCRANEDYELALEALSEAVSKTDDANMNFLITMETSSIHKEKGDYQQASSIIAAYMIQFGDTLNSESQMDLLLNLKYIEILQELLASNGTPDMPLKLIPNLLLKKAEDRLEEWKWKMLI